MQALALLQSHYQEYTELDQNFLCERVKVQTADLLTYALCTNGWERTDTPSFGYQVLDSVCTMFVVPHMSTVVWFRMIGERERLRCNTYRISNSPKARA